MTLQALRLRDALPRARRRDADGRRRPVGQHHGRASSSSAEPAATPTRAPPTASRTSCCCRRRARSSARARAATPCGSTRRGRRPTRSTSTGSRRTTATSGTYLRWFTEFPRERIEALDAEVVAHPEQRAAQRALAFDVTARVHGEARPRRAVASRQGVPARAITRPRASLAGRTTSRARGPARRRRRGRRLAIAARLAIGLERLPVEGRGPRGDGRAAAFYVNDVRVTDPAAPLPEPLARAVLGPGRTAASASGWSSRAE